MELVCYRQKPNKSAASRVAERLRDLSNFKVGAGVALAPVLQK